MQLLSSSGTYITPLVGSIAVDGQLRAPEAAGHMKSTRPGLRLELAPHGFLAGFRIDGSDKRLHPEILRECVAAIGAGRWRRKWPSCHPSPAWVHPCPDLAASRVIVRTPSRGPTHRGSRAGSTSAGVRCQDRAPGSSWCRAHRCLESFLPARGTSSVPTSYVLPGAEVRGVQLRIKNCRWSIRPNRNVHRPARAFQLSPPGWPGRAIVSKCHSSLPVAASRPTM